MKVTAVVAAYNEQQTIANVLGSLQRSPLIDEIIVVSDGSTDATVEIARAHDVRTIALRRNQGKGYAMRLGVEHASNDVIFFVDADMLDLSDQHISSLVRPVLERKCEMNVGIRHRGPIRNFLHLKAHMGPVLSGIRVMRREVWEAVPAAYMERFKIELALNYFCAASGYRQRNTVIYELGHVIKESKRGILRGLAQRVDMTTEVILLHFDLYLFQTWRWSVEGDVLSGAQEYDLFEAELVD
ncbi:MAG: glycosyltransferase family 2 protein [Thermoanaerobaculia bacterium]